MAARTRRVSWLTVPETYRLERAASIIWKAWDNCYLVGSVVTRRDYRDVDLRTIVDDDALPPTDRWQFLNAAVSDWLARASRLPVDWQLQPYGESLKFVDQPRNPCGVRDLHDFFVSYPERKPT